MTENSNSQPEQSASRELVITRVFDAPRERVFAAWTDPELMKQWWGPRGFTVPYCAIDLRPGGLIHYTMRSPEGQDIWSRGVYREILEPERLVFTDSFSDEQGNLVSPTRYGLAPEWPEENQVTVEFTQEQGRTRLTLHGGVSEELGKRQQCDVGWGESFDRLSEFLGSARGEIAA